jgi:drug/metabolite transporter (DMT)-like permease
MSFPLYLLLPLISAFVYTFAAMFFKRLIDEGVNLLYINFLSNIATCLLLSPFFFCDPHAHGPVPVFHPLIVGILFIAGQTFSLLALKCGDVSVATPLLGSKVILVAFFTVAFIGIPVRPEYWIASVLVIVALVLLRSNNAADKKRFLPTVIYSLLCAACFGLSDVLIQKWTPHYNANTFIFMMFALVSLLSLGFIPFFCNSKIRFAKPVSYFLIASIGCIAVQTVLMAIALGHFGNATAINIVFSSRTIWSVVLAWGFGSFFNNNERQLNNSVFFKRLGGAALILVAIGMVMLNK